jgi:glycosyltransferase involved in cell wall biosynthesis
MAPEMKVLVLEPYYGGSHESFIKSLLRLPFCFEVMTLPARKWKWRMRLSAPYFAQELKKTRRRFDRIICSTFVDVAAFRGMAPGWVRDAPLLTYFHENQFAYPAQVEDERDLHFGLTNATTALASDSLAFNSKYDLKTFLAGLRGLLKHSTDMKLQDPASRIRAKSRVLPPGLDFSEIDAAPEPRRGGPPVVLWNHRWEHDKNPEAFFETLFRLDGAGVDFRVVVLGESFERKPAVFEEARGRLGRRLLHFGFARTRRQYARRLRLGDIAVSTARHEFFGISVLEAVRAGCRPLLPRRLSYPEMFPNKFLYEDGDLYGELRENLLEDRRLSAEEARALTEPYSWEALAPSYEDWIRNARLM